MASRPTRFEVLGHFDEPIQVAPARPRAISVGWMAVGFWIAVAGLAMNQAHADPGSADTAQLGPSPGAIRGTVRDSDGRPIDGARVTAGLLNHWNHVARRTTSPSDPQGHFAITGLDSGLYRLTVEAAGHCGARRDGLHIDADRGVEELHFVLIEGMTLTGRVVVES